MRRQAKPPGPSRSTGATWTVSRSRWSSTWKRATRSPKSSRHRMTGKTTWTNSGRSSPSTRRPGSARTDRTRYLAAKAGLVLAEQKYDAFVAVRLVKPLKANLARKRDLMKASTEAFNKLLDYEVGEVTAAATYYLAEIYGHFSVALSKSERPDRAEPRGTGAVQPGHRGSGVSLRGEGHRHPREKPPAHLPGHLQRRGSTRAFRSWPNWCRPAMTRPEEPGGLITSLDTYVFAIARPAAPPPPAPEKKAPAAEVKSPTPAAQPAAEPQQAAERSRRRPGGGPGGSAGQGAGDARAGCPGTAKPGDARKDGRT